MLDLLLLISQFTLVWQPPALYSIEDLAEGSVYRGVFDSSVNDVVDINTFHVWQTNKFTGGKEEATRLFVEVKEEFILVPDPTWTAVGVTELYMERGVVEMRMVAYSPKDT